MEKIALFLPSLRGGGAERVMVTLANELSSRGLVVDLVLVKAEGPYLEELSINVRVVDLGASRVLTCLPGLIGYLRKNRPIAMLSAMNHANLFAVLARIFSGVSTRLVLSEHTTISCSYETRKSLRGRILLLLMKIAYPFSDKVVAVSKGVAVDLSRTIGLSMDRIEVIYNPVVTEDLQRKSQEVISHPWFERHDCPVIMSVGRLTAAKDLPTLIQAFAKLQSRRSVRLMILGIGELRDELADMVNQLGLSDKVAFLGFVGNPFAFMRRASVVVLSSKFEGLPGVLIEAMACGTAVVSTNCPSGPAEILENGKWGRLVPVGDIDALCHAMVATLDDSDRPDVRLRANDFGVERAVSEYLHLFGCNCV
jgi:glycosyltransferase involved in cell wall biosynthesis